jgi:hypothetical protein
MPALLLKKFEGSPITSNLSDNNHLGAYEANNRYTNKVKQKSVKYSSGNLLIDRNFLMIYDHLF